jgi:hypothetical protein
VSAELESYNPQLPADPAGWSVADYIAALAEVDHASTWAKVRITGMLAARHGDGTLQRAAEESGIALATLKMWRSVDKAFPVEKYGRPYFSVGVATALKAREHRFELVQREEPWTVAEARALKPPADPHKDPHADLKAEPKTVTQAGGPHDGHRVAVNPKYAETWCRTCKAWFGGTTGMRPEPAWVGAGADDAADVTAPAAGKTPETAPAEPVAEAVSTEPTAEEKPHVCRVFACPECGATDTAFSENAGQLLAEVAHLRGYAADLEGQLEAAHEKIGRLSGGSDGPGRAAPAGYPQPPRQAADGPHAAVGDDFDPAPDYEDFADPVPDDEDAFLAEFSTQPAAPARGRRGRR